MTKSGSWCAAVASLSGALLVPVAAWGGTPPESFDRYAVSVRPVTRPPGGPAPRALTRHGFFHPSCVIKLRADESIDNDGVIRDQHGLLRERIAPCLYPRFDVEGRLPVGPRPPAVAKVPHAYDGWVLSFGLNVGDASAIGMGLTYSTDWIVPKAPVSIGNQDIAFFNDVETAPASSSDATGILQPVLEFNAVLGRWWIIAEYCCSPMDLQTEPIDVNVGDIIRGEIAGTNCAAGAWQDWTVTTTDVTTGKSAVLHRTGLPRTDQLTPGALDSSNVTSCDIPPTTA